MNFKHKKGKFYLFLVLICVVSVSGCSVFGGKPQKKPQVSRQEIQNSVEKEMKTPETRKIIEDAAKTQKLEELLNTPDADRLIQQKIVDNLDTAKVSIKLQEDLKKVLTTPELQKQFQEHVKKSLETPEVQKAVSFAVQEAFMKLIQGGEQGGEGQQGGGGSTDQTGGAGS